jgi:hypothetical protein
MPLAVKCECGSQLEIDEKFLGKEILCPDCQRPLPTKAPPTPPPLDIPEFRRTSGLAILSLSMSIVGFFTLIGSIAGIALGVVALKKITQQPNKLEGTVLARAGVITGGVGLFLTLILMFLPTAFVEVYMRDLLYAGRLHYPTGKSVERTTETETVRIDRPSQNAWNDWGVYTSPALVNPPFTKDDLILINTKEDAYISCEKISYQEDDENKGGRKQKALERFRDSELLNLIGRMHGHKFPGERIPFEEKKLDDKDKKGDAKKKDEKAQDYVFDMEVGGRTRRFLVHWTLKDRVRLIVLVASAPPGRFERLEKEIRESFEKVSIK